MAALAFQITLPADDLLRDLTAEDYATRETATQTLMRVDLAEALPILALALDHRDPEARARARHVLDAARVRMLELGAQKAAPVLSRALRHPHPYIRTWAEIIRLELQRPVFQPPSDPSSPFGSTSMTVIIASEVESGLPCDIAIFVDRPPRAKAHLSEFDLPGTSIGVGPVIRF